MNSSASIDLVVETYTYGGEVLGRLPDGRAAFVPFALAGEHVRVKLVDEKPRYVRARLIEVLEPSPDRVPPRCRHFTHCGGCHYQHLNYKAQLAAKQAIVQDQLVRIGKLDYVNVKPTRSGAEWLYRNHIQFHRTPQGKLGYHSSGSDTILPVEECHLPEEVLNRIWPQLDFDAPEEPTRVGLRVGLGDEVQMIIKSQSIKPPALMVEDIPVSAVHISPAGLLVMAGSEQLTMEVHQRQFQVSAGSFFQTNTTMADKLVEYLRERLPLSAETSVLELYCGVGLFSAFIAPLVEHLVCVESSASACEDFLVNLDEFDNVELYEAQSWQVFGEIDLHPDVILLDPPRSGLDKRTLDGVVEMRPPAIAYVSCDPATFARDAKRLNSANYQLQEITPFDLFPQTYHIETVSIWRRTN
jgi:23S rRNA (uracil1939-C5)-methyltransferase